MEQREERDHVLMLQEGLLGNNNNIAMEYNDDYDDQVRSYVNGGSVIVTVAVVVVVVVVSVIVVTVAVAVIPFLD
jgi:hypothetical protein